MAKRRAKRPLSTSSRFDGEALGLVLFALGVFLAITVALPPAPGAGGGVMAGARALLLDTFGWGAYLLPLVPLAYGALVFLGRDVRGLTRHMVGGVLSVLSLLCLHDLIRPGEAGQLASALMSPLFAAVGYLAALAPLLTLSLGLELVFGWPPLSLAKGAARGLLAGALALFGAGQGALESRRDGQGRARARHVLRRDLQAHARDLSVLETLYPHAQELGAWRGETRSALRGVSRLDEDGVRAQSKTLATWRESARGFVTAAARETRAAVQAEAPEGALALEQTAHEVRKRRHELAAELRTTTASAALERVRRALCMDLTRLAARAGSLERARARAEKALEKPDPSALARELPAQRTRAEAWADVMARAAEWRERAALYAGWPQLAERYDAAPAALASDLAGALSTDPEGTLTARDTWEAKLASAEGAPQPEVTQPGTSQAGTPQVGAAWGAAPIIDFAFSEPATPAPSPASSSSASTSLGERATVPLVFEPARPEAPSGAVAVAPTAVRAPWEDRAPAASLPAQGALPLARPDFDLLDPLPGAALNTASLEAGARARAGLINQTLAHFGLAAKVVDYARGPTVTRYEIEPAPGEKISRIASLSNDLARALAVGGVRVEAPVPGKSVIGLEVPNAEREPVTFHVAAAAPSFRSGRAKLPIILGKSIDGEMLVGDLAKMPHLLIAGSTGSGKSVCVNTLIVSLLYTYLPTELRFLMVDPKMVELTPYDGIPHLVRGVVTNPADAASVLLGAVTHMERRYKMMSQVGAKNLEQFNAKMRLTGESELPYLIIIIDELADLMITSPKEVESAIMRLAQMARATGMHLVLATQRPSVDILTSLIKVNVPARVAFAVSSSHDSRTILDAVGAERLTGSGDMLFYQPGLIKPQRLQGPYISEAETARITDFLRRQVFDDDFAETYGMDFDGLIGDAGGGASGRDLDFSDPFLRQAAEICIEEGQGSVSRLQRRLSVGHARAGKLMDLLEAMGIVSKHQGSKPRDVLIAAGDLPEYFGR